MESSSHVTGDDSGEGCNSCESGWTMYLASPMHGDDAGGSGKGSGSEGSSVDDGYGYIISDRRSGKKAYEDYADADADDDDSLASDASTGPAKVKAPSSPPGDCEKEDGCSHGRKSGGADKEDEEEADVRTTKFPTTSRKKAGKVDKGGESNSSRRGHSKRGSSSRRSFFLW
ncbi:hypothetical protein BAE44_0007312 [Dichanthelium oligosanthes]|uniref:Uncharacterized protein n=1 Tax=Dichanthelium oligosanthes TaxID=888268 RepID=A0A1E5W2W7_9POAL|nr:hypothetical protein BAE44_0007312 [Dichanthelium oligosanthes]